MFNSQIEVIKAILSGQEVIHNPSGAIYFVQDGKIQFRTDSKNPYCVPAHINFLNHAEFSVFFEPVEFESFCEFYDHDDQSQGIYVNVCQDIFKKLKSGNYKITLVKS